MRILIAEDDELLGQGLLDALQQQHYSVDWLCDGASALRAASDTDYDAVVLDIGLPQVDGLSVLRQLRQQKITTPVLILTARDSTADKVSGLDAGADDYLVKPFAREELLARLRALLRRQHGSDSRLVQHGDIAIDLSSHTVDYRGERLNLSRREYALLRLLLERRGHVLSREQLESHLYGWGDDVASNAVEVHIHNLRKKLYPQLIKTLRGIGYMVEKSE